MTSDPPRPYASPAPLSGRLIELLKRSPVTVCLVGGSTKDRAVAARRLHEQGLVHDGPFVRVDAGEESGTLRHGLQGWLGGTPGDPASDPVAQAHQGTLFVDSVERLPVETQRLLLALAVQRQERGWDPDRPRWNARLIIGNARELGDAAADGRMFQGLQEHLERVRIRLGDRT